MKKLLFFLISAVVLNGCATSPASKNEPAAAAKVEPTYFEKISGQNVQDLRPAATCPRSDKEFATSTWRQMSAMAAACVKAGDWNRVDQLGNAIAIKGSKAPWGAYYMGMAADAKKNYPRAIWMMELALKKAPGEGILHYELGRIRWQMGDDILALKEMKQASDLNPSLTEAHWITGMVALNTDKLGDAETAFQKALATDRNHFPSVMALAEVKMRQKDWVHAASELNQAISINPRSTKARLVLAGMHETQLKQVQEALDAYKDLKRLSAANKLDAPLNINVDDKIRTIEGTLKQSLKPQVSKRQPSSTEGKVAK
jgi:tetratricopeptide (TPR) repeat protein